MELATKIELVQIWLAGLTVLAIVVVCFLLHGLENLRRKYLQDKRLFNVHFERMQDSIDRLRECNNANYRLVEQAKVRISLLEAALVEAAYADSEPVPEPKKVLITVTDTDGDNVYERHVPADYADEVIAMMDDATDLIGAEPDVPEEVKEFEMFTKASPLSAAASVVGNKGGKDANKVQEG